MPSRAAATFAALLVAQLGQGFATPAQAAPECPSTQVSIDLGWRVQGETTQPCGPWIAPPNNTCVDTSPPQDDWHSWVVSAASLDDCSAAACAAHSAAYSWNGTLCIIGDSSTLSPGVSSCVGFTTGVRDPSAWPPANPPEASPALLDAAWPVIDLPHDAAASAPHVFPATGGQGFRHPVSAFYRKHFRLNASWAGCALILSLPGAATSSAWWLNGVQLAPRSDAGYLPQSLRIDDTQFNLSYGPGGSNVLVAWAGNMARTGWWEEGAGLTRGGAVLLVAPPIGMLAPEGVAAPAFLTGPVTTRQTPADGLTADAAVSPSADVVLASSSTATVTWLLLDAQGVSVSVINASANLPAGGGPVVSAPGSMPVPAAELWSVARPYLYTLRTELRVGDVLLDSRDAAVGIRDVDWTGDAGLALNLQPVKLRGHCDHATWGGVGAAVPLRADFLRLQQLRGAGANTLRTSHNPPSSQLLDLADRLGVVILDENRVLADLGNVRGGAECGPGGCRSLPFYAGDPVADAAALARRDRLHASVAFYSLCNELGCGPGTLLENDVVARVKAAMVAQDASRAISGNMGWQTANATHPGTPMAELLDVMGMSHQSAAVLEAFHAATPFKPVAMTECCSCETSELRVDGQDDGKGNRH